jgi:hypothetical protein
MVFIKSDNQSFPDNRWNDFVVVVLTWWLDSFDRGLREGPGCSFRLRFMDGPFWVDVLLRDLGRARFTFNEDRLNGPFVHGIAEGDLNTFLDSVLLSSREVLLVCQAKGYTSTDIGTLQNLVQRVEVLRGASSRD